MVLSDKRLENFGEAFIVIKNYEVRNLNNLIDKVTK